MYSRDELADFFLGEGVGYNVQEGFIEADQIEDPQLSAIVFRLQGTWNSWRLYVDKANQLFDAYYNNE